LIDTAGGGAPETSQNGWGRGLQGSATREAQSDQLADQPLDGRLGNCRPLSDAAGQSVDVAGRLVCKTAGICTAGPMQCRY